MKLEIKQLLLSFCLFVVFKESVFLLLFSDGWGAAEILLLLPNVSQNCKELTFKQDLRRLLVPTLAHSRASSEVRLGYSGPYPVGSGKSPMMETAQSLQTACPTTGLFSESGIFSSYPA